MPINKKLVTAIKHFKNYFEDNSFQAIEALVVIGVINIYLIKHPLDSLEDKDELSRLDRMIKEYRQYL